MRKLTRLAIILSITLLLVLFVALSLPALGNFLVAEDEPEPSRIMVVLMGSGPDRMLGAVDIYNQGYAEKIVMVKNMVRGYDLALDKGVKIPHDVELVGDVAVQLGVPPGKIVILPGDALSTMDEALAVREYLIHRPEIDSLILVTSKYHSGRAKKIFVRAMGSLDREVAVISCPTEYDDFNADEWWKSREDLKRGVMEYLKLVNFAVSKIKG